MKAKIFSGNNKNELTDEINNFIEQNKVSFIVDYKLSTLIRNNKIEYIILMQYE